MNILFVVLILILVIRYTTREKFTQMSKMRAFIINGDKDGDNQSGRIKERWDRTKDICSDVLGLDCQRVPAYYVTSNMKEDIEEKCGRSFINESANLRYVIGCKNAHRKALESVIQHGERSIIFEDDIILPLNTNDVVSKIRNFIEENKDKDLAYLGHWENKWNTHAYIVSPEAAKKLLDSINWCDPKPVDVIMAEQCKSNLTCVYAEDYTGERPEGSWSNGIILQEGEPIRNGGNF